MNAQNLWAANTLGRFYLRSGKALEGIDLLSKLSFFHDLDSDRLATLGTALVEQGDYGRARDVFNKGAAIAGSGDQRFTEGLAKVKLGEHDYNGAIELLAGKPLSSEFVSFLNMRAVMAIKKGEFRDGVSYYQYALKGAGDAAITKAKVLFNLGLAYMRQGNFEEAKQSFLDSCRLGGREFQRANGPLERVTARLLASAAAPKTNAQDELMHSEDEIEWESFG
jgi:tetratricopeptide (TPR) repeat protein